MRRQIRADTHTHARDNYSNRRCAHACRGLMIIVIIIIIIIVIIIIIIIIIILYLPSLQG